LKLKRVNQKNCFIKKAKIQKYLQKNVFDFCFWMKNIVNKACGEKICLSEVGEKKTKSTKEKKLEN